MWATGIAAAASLVAVATFAILSGTQESEAGPVIPQYGNIIQSGALAGWASGAKISSHDRSVVEFEEISNARQLVQRDEFEYGGLKLRISQVFQVAYAPVKDGTAGRDARPDMTLVRVTAKIQPPR
jgi:hypothetical protein